MAIKIHQKQSKVENFTSFFYDHDFFIQIICIGFSGRQSISFLVNIPTVNKSIWQIVYVTILCSTPKHLRHYYSEEKEVNDLVVEQGGTFSSIWKTTSLHANNVPHFFQFYASSRHSQVPTFKGDTTTECTSPNLSWRKTVTCILLFSTTSHCGRTEFVSKPFLVQTSFRR